MGGITIRPFEKQDQPWKEEMLKASWGSVTIARKGELIDISGDAGFVALQGEDRSGMITYRVQSDRMEVTNLLSLIPQKGIGSQLLEAVISLARVQGLKTVWLITTNDNVSALKFYQKRGFHLVALYPLAVERARLLKPEIPLTGLENIPLRDELELELTLD